MKDITDKVIYVGKASKLKQRVMSYFIGKKDLKTELLRRKVNRVEIILCENPYEALVLEDNLIKKHQPRYNINLKDDKTYPLLRLTNEEFPRLFATRKRIEDGSLYFGPFPDHQKMLKYLQLLQKHFQLRRCSGKLAKRQHPCLYYHTGDCRAPCIGKISAAEYQHQVQRAKSILAGNYKNLQQSLTSAMNNAAANLLFEQAANYRDMIAALQQIELRQPMRDYSSDQRDYLAMINYDDWFFFSLLRVGDGQVGASENYHCQYPGTAAEAIGQFLLSYYQHRGNEIPEKIYLQYHDDYQTLAQYLSQLKKSTVQIITSNQQKRDTILLQRAHENAVREQQLWSQRNGNTHGMQMLARILQLPQLPYLIEGFDISHCDGHNTVAALVRFVNGQPDKHGYRYLRITSLPAGRINDYQSIREAVGRRYSRLINQSEVLPDLILIDGGKGQVNVAAQMLAELEVNIPVVGLAKRHEWLFLPHSSEPIVLPPGNLALLLLQRVRNEAHRFSNKYTQKMRDNSIKIRSLENIPGIGPKRSAKLLTTYGSLQNIAQCSSEELAATIKISPELVAILKHYLEIWLHK